MTDKIKNSSSSIDFAKVINQISQNWFLTEPLLFSVYCTHQLTENSKLKVPFRTGNKKIEYCPGVIQKLNSKQIEEYLKIEIIRILLKHPYQRQPSNGKKPYLSAASDATIYASYTTDVSLEGVNLIKDIVHRSVLLNNGFGHGNKRTHSLTTETDNPIKIPEHIKHAEIFNYLNKRNAQIIRQTEKGITAKIQDLFFYFEDDGEYYVTYFKEKEDMKYRRYYSASNTVFWEQLYNRENGIVHFPKNICFEEYCSKITTFMEIIEKDGTEKILDGNTDSSDDENPESIETFKNEIEKLSELSEMWNQDDQASSEINNLIEDAERAEQWGSVSGDIKELIKASREVQVNYPEIMRHFCSSILSSRRTLTRMKPSRRFGFEQMGNRFNLQSKILIGVDTSSSITSENLEFVFSVINKFFRYGVERLDVLQFDEKIKGEVMEMKRARDLIEIQGRVGTEFQPVADFYCSHKEYDGLIIFTDGFGPTPEFKNRSKVNVLWIFSTKEHLKKGEKWVSKLPGNFATYIPLN